MLDTLLKLNETALASHRGCLSYIQWQDCSLCLFLAGDEDLKCPFTPGNFLRLAGEVTGKAHKILFPLAL